MSQFSVENFLFQSAEKFRRGTLQSFISFGYRKKSCFRGLCHDSPSKIFCLTMPKKFAEEPFCAVFQKSSGSEKIYGQEGGKCQNFPSKFFCLKVPKNFVGEPSSLSLISGIEKVWMRGWG